MINEKKGFTKREKRMLLLLAFVGFTTLMVMYVIIPFYNNWQDEMERYNALSVEQMQIRSLLASAPVLRNNHEEALQHFDAARGRFLDKSHISEIGRLLTILCEDYNLRVMDQRLSPPTVPAQWDAFTVMPVVMTVSGTYADLTRFLDRIYATEYLRITRVSFGLDGIGRTQVLDRITLHFEVIMMQDLEE